MAQVKWVGSRYHEVHKASKFSLMGLLSSTSFFNHLTAQYSEIKYISFLRTNNWSNLSSINWMLFRKTLKTPVQLIYY